MDSQQTAHSAPTDRRNDAELVAAIATSRDRDALVELMNRYERQAYGLALRITGNADLAEEVVHEAFVRVWTSAHLYRGEGEVPAWLMKIASRESLRASNRKKRNAARMTSHESDIPDEKVSSVEGAESSELAEALRREFQRLSEIERQIVGLHFGGGLTQQEISAALVIPQQTISYKLAGVLKRLRANLTAAGYAAAVPMLCAEGLGAALRSGHDIPAGLREKVLSSLSSMRPARGSRSVRKIVSHASSTPVLAVGAAIVAVAAAGIWIAASSSNSAASSLPPPSAQTSRVSQDAGSTPALPPSIAPAEIPKDKRPMGKPRDWHRRWTFENGVPEDLNLIHDTVWTWNAATKSMDAPVLARFFPTYRLPGQPMLFTIKCREIDTKGLIITNAIPIHGEAAIPVRRWSVRARLKAPEVEAQIYLYQNYSVYLIDGEIGDVRQYAERCDIDYIVLEVGNLSVREIDAAPLSENEVPDFVKNLEVAHKGLPEWKD